MNLEAELAAIVRLVVREELARLAPPAFDPLQLLTPEQVAELLALHLDTVRARLGDGTLPGFKMEGYWRTKRVDLARYIADEAKQPTGADEDAEIAQLARDMRGSRKAG